MWMRLRSELRFIPPLNRFVRISKPTKNYWWSFLLFYDPEIGEKMRNSLINRFICSFHIECVRNWCSIRISRTRPTSYIFHELSISKNIGTEYRLTESFKSNNANARVSITPCHFNQSYFEHINSRKLPVPFSSIHFIAERPFSDICHSHTRTQSETHMQLHEHHNTNLEFNGTILNDRRV